MRLATILVVLAVALLPVGSTANAPPSYQGFGADTPGGAGGDVVRVTTLADAGSGSLREALASGNRTIVFDVAGVIELREHLFVRGSHVTIDGHSAPSPGITLSHYGLVIRGRDGAHDVIVRGLRIRKAAIDGIQVSYGAHKVVIDHVSIHGSADGNLDITEGSRDVTVSWSILAEPAGESKNMLIKYNPSRITLHHNLFVGARQRNPQVRIDDAGTPATDLTVDMRNNVVWNWRNGYGTRIWFGARANVVNNYFGSPGSSPTGRLRGILVCRTECEGGAASAARAWVDGNVGWESAHAGINTHGTESAPFTAAAVTTEPACAAAARILAEAGAQPLDAIDQGHVGAVQASPCRPS
jgi:pectate lyase